MKRIILPALAMISGIALLTAFQLPAARSVVNTPQDKLNLGFPEGINEIMESTCFHCHTTASNNEKAKGKLNFSEWNDLTKAKRIGVLEKISEVVNEGKMPPSKFLEHYPDKALSPEQVKAFTKWADDESNKLLGE